MRIFSDKFILQICKTFRYVLTSLDLKADCENDNEGQQAFIARHIYIYIFRCLYMFPLLTINYLC